MTSDSGAVADIYLNDSHAYAASPPEGVALALNATCDVDSNLGTGDEDTGSPYTWYVQDAVDEGLLEYDENGGGISNPVDAAMNRTLFLRFALGLFDYYGPDDDQDAAKNPGTSTRGSSPVTRTSSSPAKPRNSLRPAPQRPDNNNGDKDGEMDGEIGERNDQHDDSDDAAVREGQKVAVIGPHANATEALLGNYLGQIYEASRTGAA